MAILRWNLYWYVVVRRLVGSVRALIFICRGRAPTTDSECLVGRLRPTAGVKDPHPTPDGSCKRHSVILIILLQPFSYVEHCNQRVPYK